MERTVKRQLSAVGACCCGYIGTANLWAAATTASGGALIAGLSFAALTAGCAWYAATGRWPA